MDKEGFVALRQAMEQYAPLSNDTWQSIQSLCSPVHTAKHQTLYHIGTVPSSFAFVVQGLVRSFSVNVDGSEYNKNFFAEEQFPGAMTALLTQTPSQLGFESIEDSLIITIDFDGFRQLLFTNTELMTYHIHYLEKNWLLHKDAREIELVQDEATARYQQFIRDYPHLLNRLPLYHIASHIGVTPTQLSRIRKKLSAS